MCIIGWLLMSWANLNCSALCFFDCICFCLVYLIFKRILQFWILSFGFTGKIAALTLLTWAVLYFFFSVLTWTLFSICLCPYLLLYWHCFSSLNWYFLLIQDWIVCKKNPTLKFPLQDWDLSLKNCFGFGPIFGKYLQLDICFQRSSYFCWFSFLFVLMCCQVDLSFFFISSHVDFSIHDFLIIIICFLFSTLGQSL